MHCSSCINTTKNHRRGQFNADDFKTASHGGMVQNQLWLLTGQKLITHGTATAGPAYPDETAFMRLETNAKDRVLDYYGYYMRSSN